jgi:hypothetical protein
MKRFLWTALASVAIVTSVTAQKTQFPDTPQGKLAAGFFAAVGAPDDSALVRFQEANFSEAALKRRSPEERLERNRTLREMAGALSLLEVKSATETQLVVTARGTNATGEVLTVTFTFTAGPAPKIDAVQISGP